MKRDNMLYELGLPEAMEVLERLEREILSLENLDSNSSNTAEELINTIFRHFHTLKGNAGIFELNVVGKITHVAETLLDFFRDSAAQNSARAVESLVGYTDILIKTTDFIRRLYELVEETGSDKDLEHEAAGYIDALTEVINNIAPKSYEKQEKYNNKNKKYGLFDEEASQKFGLFDDAESKQLEKNSITDKKKAQTNLSTKVKAKTATLKSGGNGRSSITRNIRVNAEKLDSLLDLVGELVIAESVVGQHPDLQGLQIENFWRAESSLGRIVRSLQETSLSLRMIPLTSVFQRMVRLVRDLSKKSGKEINFSINGEDTEIDKSMVELIVDPLVHIIRNAVDHGFETTENRVNAGKPKAGNLSLEAGHTGGEVRIVVKDDGRGLDRTKIIKKAKQIGLLPDKASSNLSDRQVYQFIFMPGFSTKEKVTDISGRGVGLDVVKKNLSKLNGRIRVKSQQGKGTTFIINIPLTLAIIDGMVMKTGQSFFIIPTIEINETIRLNNYKMIDLHDGYAIKVREHIIPLINLSEILKLQSAVSKNDSKTLVVIIGRYKENRVGVIVDEILGNQQVVIKSLRESFKMKDTKGIAGCTILGNGEPALILDVGVFLAHYKTVK
jgi:two-component system chemotaxis sensor kinase CheA